MKKKKKKKRSSFNLVGLWAWDSSPRDCFMRLDIEQWYEMTSRGNKVLFSCCSLFFGCPLHGRMEQVLNEIVKLHK